MSTGFSIMVNDNLIQRDLKHVWHPCTQMKDFENEPPFIVHEAKGSVLYTDHGPLIDACSSWWCKSLGHQPDAVLAAIQQQFQRFEHVIGANSTHPVIVALAEKLSRITGLDHAFFASDGSCAVEIAMKLAVHACQLRGKPEKKQFIALENAYHGETLATLAVSDLGIYKKPYENMGPVCNFIHSIPYVNDETHPLWSNCEKEWLLIEKQLEPLSQTCCAIIVEPLIQGAGGMNIYSADFLVRLSKWAKQHDIYLIADEIMTGFGRCGDWLASRTAGIQPDIICMSKSLTAGTVPFSTAMISDDIYQLFYDDYETGKSFLHSHTYSGYAVGAAAALATINYMEETAIIPKIKQLEQWMRDAFSYIADKSQQLTNIRSLGGVIAADLCLDAIPRAGYQLYREALRHGAFLRPLGNTLYWMPPLNIDETHIGKLCEITLKSIESMKNRVKG